MEWDPDSVVNAARRGTVVVNQGDEKTGPTRDRQTSTEARIARQADLTPEERAADQAFNRTPENLAELERTIRDEKNPTARATLEQERDALCRTSRPGA
jgi:hypothetical protein